MNFFYYKFLLIILVFSYYTKCNEIGKGIYKLPELFVESESSYLIRNTETKLKCVIAGQPIEWKNATLDRVIWLKEGVPINHDNESYNLEKSPLSQVPNTILKIVQISYHTEGEYQCSAILRNLNVLPEKTVDSRLVSAPLKLRRARITKFERYDASIVRVKQGQVARLPCHGMPDIIPGPPEIWFEKYGYEGLALGRTGNERFIVTSSALQIALTQPSDSGRYFCIVQNTFTNQTRKAPRPIVLIVDSNMFLNDYQQSQKNSELQRQPRIIYPELINYSEPVEFHVVAGQTAILECVIWEAKIIWNRTNSKSFPISVTDDRARIRQIWGNLRIKHITMDDSGIYVCYGISPLLLASNTNSKNEETLLSELTKHKVYNIPKITYRLVVHAPTNVRLSLAQLKNEKSWQLNCYAHNLHYEIPMVYVNGLALIDAMDELNIAHHTNFFTNPINVTINSKNSLTGSVQCISRPAMEEAEVYGTGLERGRAMNLYIDSWSLNNSYVNLSKTVSNQIQNEEDKKIIYDDEKSLQILRPMAFIAEDNSVRLQWSIEPKNHSRLLQIQNFIIELLNYNKKYESKTKNQWINIEKIPPHLRAFTIKNILTNLEDNNEFQLRIVANFINRQSLISEPTAWLKIKKKVLSKIDLNKESKEIDKFNERDLNSQQSTNLYYDENEETELTSNALIITRLQTVSHESMLVAWKYFKSQKIDIEMSLENNFIQKYIITYEALDDNIFLNNKLNEKSLSTKSNSKYTKNIFNLNQIKRKAIEVEAKFMEILLTELEPNTNYRIFITAVYSNGQKSQPSKSRIAKTFAKNDELDNNNFFWWTKIRQNYLNLPDVSLKFELMLGALCIAAIMLIILCFLTTFRLREWHRHRQDRGSSIDSNRYFLENSSPSYSSPSSTPHNLKKRDRQLYHEPCYFSIKDPISELSPLGFHSNTHLPSESPIINNSMKELKPLIVDNIDEKCEYISRKALIAALNETTIKKNESINISNTVKRPNLYGNAEQTTNDALDEVYDPLLKTKKYKTYSHNEKKLNTLKQGASLQRQRLNTNEFSNSAEYNNEINYLNNKIINLNSELKLPSPTEINASSMYDSNGMSNFDYSSSNAHRYLMQQLTPQKINRMEMSSNTSIINKIEKEFLLKDENNYLNHFNSKNNATLLTNPHNNQLLSDQMVNIKNNGNNSLCSSKISLSNCGSSTMTSNDFQQSSKLTCYNFDSYKDCLLDYVIDQKLGTTNTSINLSSKNYGTISSKQMSTFKSSSIPTSGSSGYNSYSGSGLTISGINNYNTENKSITDYVSNSNYQFCNKNLNNTQPLLNNNVNNLNHVDQKSTITNQNCNTLDRNKQYLPISILTPVETPLNLEDNKFLSFET